MVGRERFELCRPVPVLVLDPTVISRVLLGRKSIAGSQLTVLSYRPNEFSAETKTRIKIFRVSSLGCFHKVLRLR